MGGRQGGGHGGDREIRGHGDRHLFRGVVGEGMGDYEGDVLLARCRLEQCVTRNPAVAAMILAV